MRKKKGWMGKVELGKHDVGIFELPNRGATRKESNFQNGESMGIYSYAMDICCLLAGCPIALGHFQFWTWSQSRDWVCFNLASCIQCILICSKKTTLPALKALFSWRISHIFTYFHMIFSLVHHYPPIQKWYEFSHEFSLQNLGGRPVAQPFRSTKKDLDRVPASIGGGGYGHGEQFFLGGTMKTDDLSDLSICFLMGISAYHGKWMNMMISLWKF